MDFNIEVRKKQLDHLDQLISSSKDKIHSVLNCLGWTTKEVEKDDPLVACPTNIHHRISTQCWSQHVEKCFVKQQGYDLTEQFLSESPEDSSTSIYLDRNKKCEIIAKELGETKDFRLAWNGLDPDPRTSDRMFSTYSPHERLAFYNYSTQNTTGPTTPPEFTTIHHDEVVEDKPLDYIEMLKKERDAKRRSAKYKSVHINKKNHTEVIREVINGQMEEYKQWLEDNDKIKTYQKQRDCSTNGNHDVNKEKSDELAERPHSSISKHSNRSGSSRRHDSYSRRDRSPYHRHHHHHHDGGHHGRKYSPDERGHNRNRHYDRDGRFSSRDRERHRYDGRY